MAIMMVAPFGSVVWAVGSIAVTLAAWVLIAHLASPKVKRVIGAGVLAVVVASAATVRAEDDDFLKQDPCKKYTSSDWQWWAAGCFWP